MAPDLALRVVIGLDLPDTLNDDVAGFDKYRLQSDPGLLRDIAASLAALIPQTSRCSPGSSLVGFHSQQRFPCATGGRWQSSGSNRGAPMGVSRAPRCREGESR
jgi:hypothetical protein